MVQAKKSLKQRLRMAAIITLAVLAVLTGGFLWYVSDYYRAEDTALQCWPRRTASPSRTT